MKNYILGIAENYPALRRVLWSLYRWKNRQFHIGAPPPRAPQPDIQPILSQVQTDGYALIPGYWDEARCAACVDQIDGALRALSGSFHEATGGEMPDERIYGFQHYSPLALAYATDPLLLRLANAYPDRPVGLFSTLANRVAKPAEYGSGGMWHRDGFFPQLKTLLYLTEVSADNGPFELLAQSHVWSPRYGADQDTYGFKFRQHRLEEGASAMLRDEPQRKRQFACPAGTLVVFDTTGIHRGAPLASGARYALTNYYVDNTLLNDSLHKLFAPILLSGNSYLGKDGAIHDIVL